MTMTGPVTRAETAENIYPMVPVPDALTTVLRETAKHLIDLGGEASSNSSTRITALHLHSTGGTPQYQPLLGRILANDIIVKDPYPPFDASIMDGYAVKCENWEAAASPNGWTHEIVGRIFAGDDVTGKDNHVRPLSSLPSAVYVTTGAVVPAPYNAVVPMEECLVDANNTRLRITSPPSNTTNGKWIRKVGCDMASGSVALSRGTVIQPSHIGILIQAGADSIQVRDLPRVGVLSTGNEIKPSHQNADMSGRIPDANRPVLLSTLAQWGNCHPIDLGIETDDMNHLAATLKGAVESCDVIITTGGISMGEKDIIENVLVNLFGANVHFGRIHMKPGKPTTFMTIGVEGQNHLQKKICLAFCLPGNPVSGVVCSHLFVRPCLEMIVRGVDETQPLDDILKDAVVQEEVFATLLHDCKLDLERPEYRRVSLAYDSNTSANEGKFLAVSTGVQRSSRLMSMREADGLMLLPKGESSKMIAKKGEVYPVMLLGGHFGGSGGIQVRYSVHMSGGKLLKLGVVQVVSGPEKESKDAIANRVSRALKRNEFRITAVLTTNVDNMLSTLDSTALKEVDVIVFVVGSAIPFGKSLNLASNLRMKIDIEADAVSLQARKGASVQDPTAALFEFVAGFRSCDESQFLILLLTENGLEGSLSRIGGLLPHAISVRRTA